MAYSTSTHTVTASQATSKTFTLGFDYLRAVHVTATVEGVANTDFTLDSASGVLTFGASTTLEESDVVVLTRTTPAAKTGRVIDFADGSILSESALDESALQNLYVSQEALDDAESALTAATAATVPFTHETTGTNEDGAVPAPTPAEVTAQKFLRSDGTWQEPPGTGSGSGGSSTFVGLTDTPAQFASNAGDKTKFVKVDQEGTALEFTSFIGALDSLDDVRDDEPASDGDALVYSSGPETGWGPSPTVKTDIATALTPYEAGKIWVANGTQYTPLAKGADQQVLTSTTSGLQWQAAASGGVRGSIHRYGPDTEITSGTGIPVKWDKPYSLDGPFTVESGMIGSAGAATTSAAIQVDEAGYYSFQIQVGIKNISGATAEFTLLAYYRATDGTTTVPSLAAGRSTVTVADDEEASISIGYSFNMALNSALIVGVTGGSSDFSYMASKSTLTGIAL